MQSIVSLSATSIDNKCPDCVWLDIQAELIQQKSFFGKPSTSQIILYITLQFNEQWYALPNGNGRIKFGLRGGELRLKLENCKISPDDRELCGELSLETVIKRKQQISEEHSVGAKLIAKGAEANYGRKETTGTSNEFEFKTCHVTTKGSEQEPAWEFEPRQGEPVLKGLLKKTKLAIATVDSEPFRIQGIFMAPPKDIEMTDSEGLWFVDLIPEKRATLDRFLAMGFLKPNIQPYISQLELRADYV
jgi:hypothetical protein